MRATSKQITVKTDIKLSGQNSKSPSALYDEVHVKLEKFVAAQRFAEENFDAKINKHVDWILIQLLLKNDANGRSTVVKHVIESARCSPGTVRVMFNRFQKNGYIEAQEKIGRSELFRPTTKLKKFITKWANTNFQE